MKFIKESFTGNVSMVGAELDFLHVKQIIVELSKDDEMHLWQKV